MKICNLTFKLMWFAKEQEWRLYAEDGSYWPAKTIKEIPGCVCGLLTSGCEQTLKLLETGGDIV